MTRQAQPYVAIRDEGRLKRTDQTGACAEGNTAPSVGEGVGGIVTLVVSWCDVCGPEAVSVHGCDHEWLADSMHGGQDAGQVISEASRPST